MVSSPARVKNLNTEKEKERSHGSVYVQLIKYENVLRKPLSEELTKQLQGEDNNTLLVDRVAFSHPLPIAKFLELHRNPNNCLQSESSLSSKCSFCLDRHGFPCFRPNKKFTFSTSEVKHMLRIELIETARVCKVEKNVISIQFMISIEDSLKIFLNF